MTDKIKISFEASEGFYKTLNSLAKELSIDQAEVLSRALGVAKKVHDIQEEGRYFRTYPVKYRAYFDMAPALVLVVFIGSILGTIFGCML